MIEEGEPSSPTLGHETGAERKREKNNRRRRERMKSRARRKWVNGAATSCCCGWDKKNALCSYVFKERRGEGKQSGSVLCGVCAIRAAE